MSNSLVLDILPAATQTMRFALPLYTSLYDIPPPAEGGSSSQILRYYDIMLFGPPDRTVVDENGRVVFSATGGYTSLFQIPPPAGDEDLPMEDLVSYYEYHMFGSSGRRRTRI